MTEYQSVIQKGPATIAEQRRERAVIVGIYAVVLLSVYLFIYRGRAHVADVYNRE